MDTFLQEFNENKVLFDKSGIKISTMTIIVELEKGFNIMKEMCQGNFMGYEAEYKCPKGKKTGDEFMNQFTIKYQDAKGKKNIKVFPNGKLQMTGIKNAQEVADITKNVIQLMCDEDVTVNLVKYGMLNSNIHVGMGLNLNILSQILQYENTYVPNLELPFTFHDPNKYPGLRIKYTDATCLIFASGSVMIAGSKSMKNVNKTYHYITELLKKNKKHVECPELLKIKKKI